MHIYIYIYIWQDGFKLRDYLKAEGDIRLLGDKIAKNILFQHSELKILVPHPAPTKDETTYLYIYITYYILSIIRCVLIDYRLPLMHMCSAVMGPYSLRLNICASRVAHRAIHNILGLPPNSFSRKLTNYVALCSGINPLPIMSYCSAIRYRSAVSETPT